MLGAGFVGRGKTQPDTQGSPQSNKLMGERARIGSSDAVCVPVTKCCVTNYPQTQRLKWSLHYARGLGGWRIRTGPPGEARPCSWMSGCRGEDTEPEAAASRPWVYAPLWWAVFAGIEAGTSMLWPAGAPVHGVWASCGTAASGSRVSQLVVSGSLMKCPSSGGQRCSVFEALAG